MVEVEVVMGVVVDQGNVDDDDDDDDGYMTRLKPPMLSLLLPLVYALIAVVVVAVVVLVVARGGPLDTPHIEEEEDEEKEDVVGREDGGGTRGVPPKAKCGRDSRGLADRASGSGREGVDVSGCDGGGSCDEGSWDDGCIAADVLMLVSNAAEPLSLCCAVWREKDRAPSIIRKGAGARLE